MRKLNIILIFILTASLFFAQNQRFTYEYSYKMDSLNKENVEKEMMNLDITKEGSNFYSALLLTKDSLFTAEVEKGKASQSVVIDMRKIKQAKVNFRVSKAYPGLETVYHSSINATNIAVKEQNKINWAIFPDTKSIEGFKVQKATTTFGGRNWIAWFTNDIQIQDGPYKFCGLPGLILNIEDEKGDHIFNLKGSQKLNYKPLLLNSKMKDVFLTNEKFNKLWNEYKKDPAKNIKLIHSSSEMSDTLFFDSNTGSPLTKQDLIKGKEQRARENFKKYNNYIEIELYK
ncbi:GLPGLI family protein [Chryseobacterium indoltheticum]|uniref:GLPGLI family protein n=1 Tax=Chryseobacterium indoltheticum TaxID=254 RepID=A0A381F8N2_9FLAO|nr:GLPGLI family protein [Chryseobacterium indoltheticum]AZA73145.1 GLPGLI family protein [Chryseobacterium indoltheticum]SIP95170.1 GLPGLI family protein [Chryseobacterium indoltheticum]SUX42804.1 GLPGLI family protein [Chryseobacterium indoltheticum]